MTMFQWLLIFLLILFSYVIIVYILKIKGILEKYNVSLWGPALLLRTTKGRSFLKKISNRKRFWKAFGSFAVVFCFIMMVLMVFVLIFQVWAIIGFTPEQRASLPGPEIALVLPGINPILPLDYIVYIVLALVVAMIVHEFSHGILTLAADLKVKSLGILYFIFPVGAFCEPDEEQLKQTQTMKRMRVYAAGPLANFVVVIISMCIFSAMMLSVVPYAEGIGVESVYEDTDAYDVGIRPGAIITSINDTDFTGYSSIEERTVVYLEVMDKTNANDTVNITYVLNKKSFSGQIKLVDKYGYISKDIRDKGKGFTGANSFIIEGRLDMLKNPIFNDFPFSMLYFYVIPLLGYFQGYNPIVSPFIESYEITGPLSALPDGVFWGIVNALYWIFWLNLAVGLFNVLPMVPLDGGFLFNDAMGSIVKKFKKGISDEEKDKIVGRISVVISLIILAIVVFPFFAKYI